MGTIPCSNMRSLLVLVFIANFSFSYQAWCGDQPIWRKEEDSGYYKKYIPGNDKRLTFMPPDLERSYDFLDMTTSLNHTSGLFTAPGTKDYLVTLTAQIFPIDSPSHLENYAQLFSLRMVSSPPWIIIW